ncbi:ring finger domain-containing protein [Pochonia chlamydosporia 170]|uniref:Ring finger domain-containing protein n=1 Tax=Pochonia chlamydosporia 170 TaxID=1380566 RepID=A0A179FH81_METCM|nr:ring finger domain-containing protein [Pochonia chlamydosporia 170]OAQ64894.1 ring finger domain-containing protein [Pochonia chlamydosporia 170]
MIRAKEVIAQLTQRYGRDYLERVLLRIGASTENKEPLLTTRPVDENEPTTPVDDANRTVRPQPTESTGQSHTSVPNRRCIFSSRSRTLRVRNPTERRSIGSQDTIAATASEQLVSGNDGGQSRQPSVGHFTFETSEAGSEDITPMNILDNAGSSISVASTLASSRDANFDSNGRPLRCCMCAKAFGDGEGQAKEQVVYLPCGHGMGHVCLLDWLSKPNSLPRCPMLPCISIRHKCEHITMPTTKSPVTRFGQDNEADTTILPWDYEFCASPKGIKLHQSIASTSAKLRKMEAKRARRGHAGQTSTVNPKLKIYRSILEQLEKKLDDAHKKWWAARWKEFGRKKQQSFWTRQRGNRGEESESRSTSA